MKKSHDVNTDKGSFLGLCYNCVHYFSWAVILVFALLVAAFIGLQTGLADSAISSYSQSAFQKIVGQSQVIQVEKTALRLSGDGRISVEARDFTFSGGGEEKPAFQLSVDRAQLKVDPISLAAGRTTISAVQISDVMIDLAQNEGELVAPKISNLDNLIEMVFERLSHVENLGFLTETEEIVLEDIQVNHPSLQRFGGLILKEASLSRTGNIFTHGEGTILLGEDEFPFSINRVIEAGRQSILGEVGKFAVNFETKEANPEFRSGLRTSILARFEIKSASENASSELRLALDIDQGDLKLGGEVTPLQTSQLNWFYDAKKKAIELEQSDIAVSKSVFPLTGGLIDAENFEGGDKEGIVFDFVVGEGVLAPTDTNERPIIFSAKSLGYYSFEKKELHAEELLIATGTRYAAGNAIFRFMEEGSPEINVAVQVPEIETAVAKQFWPFWLGRGTRGWATNNIFGGTIQNANLFLRIEAGRLSNPERPIRHSAENYQVDYDFKGARVNIVGDIPPVRNASGKMKLRGTKVVVSVDEGTSFFPSDRKMDIVDGSITIPDTSIVPLMADVDFNLTGWADAAAELVSFKPIDALDDIGLEPEEISGLVDAHVVARLGLIADQSPPEPVWQVELDLNGVDLTKPIEGYIPTNVTGMVDVNRERAVFEGKLKIDGVNVNAQAVEPIGESDVEKQLSLSGRLNADDRKKLKLDVNDIIVGEADFTLDRLSSGDNRIEIDLKNSTVIAPGTAWRKSKGVPASATFMLSESNGSATIKDFKFSGNGFAATGELELDDAGLISANFANVKLSPKDNYSFSVQRSGKTYNINMAGKSFDMRPLITQLKNDETSAQKYDGRKSSLNLTGKIDQVHGFGGEILSVSTMKYAEQGGIPQLAEFTGRTKQGGSVAARLKSEGQNEVITVASDDSGSFWRFFDIYAFVQGGSVDVRMLKNGDGPYVGNVNMRNFQVIGDERLDTLVSTRANAKERSLNEALKGRLDVSLVNFTQALIDVRLEDGRLDIAEGIVRGPQIGASFNGMLYDKKDNTNIAGTFMPAYALNSFFGEIPILGALLGNGREKALLGITFKVTGNADNPQIQVNPLSIVAPGVFRSIFEF